MQDYSRTSYILWGMLALGVGFGVVGLGFESTQKIFAYTPPTSSSGSPLLSSSPSSLSPLSSDVQEKEHAQKVLRETLKSSYLLASAHAYNQENQKEENEGVKEIIDESIEKKEENACPEGTGTDSLDYTTTELTENMGNYIPSTLIEIQKILPTKEGRVICLDKNAAIYLKKMLDDARILGGHDIVVTSGFRDYETQQILYNNSQKKHGDSNYLHVAKPGHSEHQLGLAVDLAGASMNYDSASSLFGETPEGMWLQENAHLYGFNMSYPKGAEEETGIIYEPWHWRFIGM